MIGAGVAVILLGLDTQAPPAGSTVVAIEVSPRGGIADELPGFPDGLVGASRSDGKSLELLIWPLRGEPYERGIPVGVSTPPDPVAFDVAGRFLATVLPVPGEVAGVLYAGTPETAEIVSLEVTGYAWHDADPAALAYTTMGEGEMLLWKTAGNLAESELVTRAVGIEGGVAAWGDWGFAVQNGESVVLFTATGEIAEVSTGRILGSHESGWVAVDDNGMRISALGGGIREVASLGSVDPILDASFSPDGNFIGVLTVRGLTVTTGEAEVAVALERPGVPQVVWSSDSRYALFPGLRGLIVLDTADGTVREMMPAEIFTGLAVLDFDET